MRTWRGGLKKVIPIVHYTVCVKGDAHLIPIFCGPPVGGGGGAKIHMVECGAIDQDLIYGSKSGNYPC